MSRLVEIDEAELQRSTRAREFVESIWNNPKARRKLLEAQKEVKPDDPLVKELDKPDPVEDTRASLTKQIEDLKKEVADREAKREQDEKLSVYKRQRDEGFAKLRAERYTQAGLDAVQKIMDEKGILDPLDAAAIWEKHNPPQSPISPTIGGNAWNFFDQPADDSDEFVKKLVDSKGGNDLLAEKRAMEALMEMRGARR